MDSVIVLSSTFSSNLRGAPFLGGARTETGLDAQTSQWIPRREFDRWPAGTRNFCDFGLTQSLQM
jgi:hypothetical protein